jgi:hypothetical protein
MPEDAQLNQSVRILLILIHRIQLIAQELFIEIFPADPPKKTSCSRFRTLPQDGARLAVGFIAQDCRYIFLLPALLR